MKKFDWEFVKVVWSYPTRSKPKVEKLLKQFANEKMIIQLKSKKEIESFLNKLSIQKILPDKINNV